jgi:hypothetical protein
MPDRPTKMALSKDERGQGQAITLIFAVFFLVLLLGLGVFVAHVQPVKVAVHAAARNCVRMAGESLAQGRGPEQGYYAAYQTMAGHNFDPAYVDVVVQQGVWDRGHAIACRVRYAVDVSGLPFVSLFYGEGAVPLEGVSLLRIEPYKSRWGE